MWRGLTGPLMQWKLVKWTLKTCIWVPLVWTGALQSHTCEEDWGDVWGRCGFLMTFRSTNFLSALVASVSRWFPERKNKPQLMRQHEEGREGGKEETLAAHQNPHIQILNQPSVCLSCETFDILTNHLFFFLSSAEFVSAAGKHQIFVFVGSQMNRWRLCLSGSLL